MKKCKSTMNEKYCHKHPWNLATNIDDDGFLFCGECAWRALEASRILIRLSDGVKVKIDNSKPEGEKLIEMCE